MKKIFCLAASAALSWAIGGPARAQVAGDPGPGARVIGPAIGGPIAPGPAAPAGPPARPAIVAPGLANLDNFYQGITISMVFIHPPVVVKLPIIGEIQATPVLAPPFSRFTVKDGAGKIIWAAEIFTFPDAETPENDTAGRYDLELPVGNYTLEIESFTDKKIDSVTKNVTVKKDEVEVIEHSITLK